MRIDCCAPLGDRCASLGWPELFGSRTHCLLADAQNEITQKLWDLISSLGSKTATRLLFALPFATEMSRRSRNPPTPATRSHHSASDRKSPSVI